ncbi:hypothetical protein PV367_02075 [Streptomyces europaeiscabiei]|uniref:Uncharacterized protein n=1 Tax=Streptomyces europaeiscabiei TaxID=146819 RepID=A0AAJ2UJD6_9ACTN|nr:hypothetical protein [Streptomyces europaeiscabiei]MDX3128610.1 hypothetical protein [Streptomyces europaeiscabiei]
MLDVHSHPFSDAVGGRRPDNLRRMFGTGERFTLLDQQVFTSAR